MAPHAPKYVTVLDTENKAPIRQLLDAQEYPITKGDIIKRSLS